MWSFRTFQNVSEDLPNSRALYAMLYMVWMQV